MSPVLVALALCPSLGCDRGAEGPEPSGSTEGAGKADGADDQEAPAVRTLDSREYKVMLDPKLFAGDDPAAAVDDYWSDLAAAAEDLGHEPEKDPADDLREREVSFFDTPGCQLRSMGYAFRHRSQGDEAEVTLKFRSLDLLLAGATSMDIHAESFKTKFEEDIVPPFSSKYSLSAKVEVESGWTPESVDDLLALAETKDLEDLDGALELVSDTVYQEHAYKGAEIDLGPVDAEVAITLWWLPDAPEQPVVAEASFSLDTDDGLSPKALRRAHEMFDAMAALDPWVAPEATTKTALVYERGAELCE